MLDQYLLAAEEDLPQDDEEGVDKGKLLAMAAEAARSRSANGLAAADILYQAYTGKQSPGAAATAEAYSRISDPVKQWLEERRTKDADADRKFKIAEYLERKRQHEADQIARRSDRDWEKDFRERQLALQEKKAGVGQDGGKAVTAGTAKEIGEFDSALNMVDQLANQYNAGASQTGSSITQFWPGSDADNYNKFRDVAAQTVGGILEGGKLTEEDYQRYRGMLPKPTDTNEIAATKIQAIKNLIAARKRGGVEALGQAGYNVSEIPIPASPNVVANDRGQKLLSDTAIAGEKSVVKKLYSPSLDKTRLIYSDGTEEMVDGRR